MRHDLFWLVASYVYVGAVIAAGTLARSGGRRSPDLTRKIIHVGVGTWIIPTTVFFNDPLLAAVPAATFLVVNALSYRFRLVRAMEEGERNAGTIYFPLAFILLILWAWPGALGRLAGLFGGAAPAEAPPAALVARYPVAAGIMAMAWGDAAASIVGRRAGRRRFKVLGSTKSLEGSASFVAWSCLGLLAADTALRLAGGVPLDVVRMVWVALTASILAGVVEAWSPWGLDNLTVPITAAATVRWMVTP